MHDAAPLPFCLIGGGCGSDPGAAPRIGTFAEPQQFGSESLDCRTTVADAIMRL
jgi:hypothetical protein